ncbi:MAG: hypothetical protein J07HB67_00001, partial [halophilic archaeon J07HB67]
SLEQLATERDDLRLFGLSEVVAAHGE